MSRTLAEWGFISEDDKEHMAGSTRKVNARPVAFASSLTRQQGHGEEYEEYEGHGAAAPILGTPAASILRFLAAGRGRVG